MGHIVQHICHSRDKTGAEEELRLPTTLEAVRNPSTAACIDRWAHNASFIVDFGLFSLFSLLGSFIGLEGIMVEIFLFWILSFCGKEFEIDIMLRVTNQNRIPLSDYPKGQNGRTCEWKYFWFPVARGDPVWLWVDKIATLREKKIVWDKSLDDPEGPTFAVSGDGIDVRKWETKHPTLPRDNGACSKKFKHAASKWEIGLAVYKSKCVWLNGPAWGGMHDMTLCRQGGLLEKLKDGKLTVLDRGYISSAESGKTSTPNDMDSPEVNNFKSRVRLRQETFNSRLKDFKVLAETFRQGKDKHEAAFVAIVVIAQYQMESGKPLFDP